MDILLKEIMESRNLSARKLAKITKIPTAALKNIVSEKKDIRIDTLEKIAKNLSLGITDLFESEYK